MTLNTSSEEQYEEGIDLRQYLALFWHWAWLIVLAALIAGAASYFYSQRMTRIYQSLTTVLVNEAPATKQTDYSSVMLSEQLTTTYAQMMNKDTVLTAVETQLGLAIPLTDLKAMITVTPVTSTQLITVTVQTTDPTLSANIANTLATVFASQIQNIQMARFSQSENSLKSQLADLTTQIDTYQAQANAATTADEKASFNALVTQYQQIYANLQQSYETVLLSEAQSVSSVVQIEPATPNLAPVKPKVMQNTLLAAVIGFLLAAGIIVAREALDDTIKTPDDISRKFKLSVLGVINHHTPEKDAPITQTEPRSPTAEAYRSLRTNVNYASVDNPLRIVMVTSAEPGEGKTTTACNLGVVLAQNGARVIIADCDLRHPRVHKYFGLSNRQGLSTLLTQADEVLDGKLQKTAIENLMVLTTGSLPPNPAELMGSQKMQRVLASMRTESDFILVDTPPVLAVTDAAVLAPTLDGVLLVVRPGKTRASALRLTMEKLQQVNANVLGVILNDIDLRRQSYTYHYHYYRNYAAYQHYYGGKEKEQD